jgi:hypothetical protein
MRAAEISSVCVKKLGSSLINRWPLSTRGPTRLGVLTAAEGPR